MLLLFGGFCLSWGGFIVRSFETSNPWEILILRSSFFFLGVSAFLISIYKKDTLTAIKKSGISALLGGFIMSFSFIAFVFAMINTSVANVVFIISTQTMFLAIFGYFYLKEKVSLISFISILLVRNFNLLNVLVVFEAYLRLCQTATLLSLTCGAPPGLLVLMPSVRGT